MPEDDLREPNRRLRIGELAPERNARGYPWRNVPAGLFGVLGAFMTINATIALIYGASREGFEAIRRAEPPALCITAFLVGGLVWLAAAWAWRTRRWFWAVLLTVAGYLVMIGWLPDR